jgi:hypothetical protein
LSRNLRQVAKSAMSVLLFSLAATCSVAPALALDFRAHPNNRSPALTAVLATGEIAAGDADRLSAYLASLPIKKNTAIYLSSTGGDLHEAMRLGGLFRQKGIKTVVEGNSDCVSACAFAFLGGTDNQGKPWRSSTSSSRLGFHAFRSASVEATPSDEVQRPEAMPNARRQKPRRA